MAQPVKPDNNYNVCMMPTKEQIEAMPGTPLTKEDILKMQAEGSLPQGLDPSMGAPTLHRIKQGDQEIIVIMIDPPPCGCVRLPNGKKKRCKKHRMERRARRRARKQKKSKETAEKGMKMVKDDESDRMKLVELRHAADSESDEDKAIDGAITPDKVCAVGPAGVAVLVEVEKVETAEVGPRAKMEKQTIKGILIKGAHETPQFIPMEKVQRDKDGNIKYRYYTTGQLVKGKHGEAIFYADGQCTCDCHGEPQNMKVEGVDETLQKKLGEQLCVPCEVEVNREGMVTVKYIACAEDVPKDKYAAVGVISKNTDGHVVFTQTAGQRIGSSDNAPVVICTPNDKAEPGTVIGIVYEDKEGKTQVLPKDTKAPADQKTVGVVLLGEYHEPVFVKDIRQSQCQKAQNMPIIIIMERDYKASQVTIEKADLVVQSKVQKKTQQEILAEKAEIKNAQPLKQEVWSTSLAPGGMQGGGGGGGYARSVFVKQGMEAEGGAAGSGGQAYTKTVKTVTTTTTTTYGGGTAGGQAYSNGVAGGQAYSKTVTTTSGGNGAGAAGGQAYSRTVTTTSGGNGAGPAGGQAYSKTVTTTSGGNGAGAAGGQAYSTVTTTSGGNGAGAAGGQTYSKTVTTTTTTKYTGGAAGAAGSQAGGPVVMVPPAGGCQIHGQAQQSMHTHTQTQTTHTHTHTGTGQHLCACLRGKGGAAGHGQQVVTTTTQTTSGGFASGVGGAGTNGAGANGAGAGKSGASSSGAGGAGAGGAGAGGAGAGGAGAGGAGAGGAGAGGAGAGAGAGGFGSGAGGAGAGGAGAGGAGGGYVPEAVSVYAGVIKVGTPGSVPWGNPPPKNADPGGHSVFVTRK